MRTRLVLLVASVLSLLPLAPSSAATPLFTESFDDNDVGWDYSSGGAPATDNTGWTWSSSVYKAKHAIRIGKSNGGVGSGTTPSISIPSGWTKASVTVSFQAAAWYGCTSGLTLSKMESGVTTSIDSWDVPQIAATKTNAVNNVADLSAFTSDSNGKSYTATFEVHGSFQVVFATTGSGNNCRSYLDSVVVTGEEIVSTLTPLPMPTGLASSDVGIFGFSLSWDAVPDADGYEVTLSPADGNVLVDGTTATVTELAEGTTYTAYVVAKGDGTTTDDSPPKTIEVITETAPAVSAPALTATGVSPSALTVSWPAQNDASFSARAWTLVPTNSAAETFAGYAADGTVPDGWIVKNSKEPFPNENAPVDFRVNGAWVASPVFGGTVESVSFYIAAAGTVTNSHFYVYGTTGTTNQTDWIRLGEATIPETGKLTTGQKTFSVDPALGITRIVFQYEKSVGNVRIGTFSVTGTDVGKAPSYLTGYGPAAVAAGATSVTISNPVVGETNYVEVTATGLTGRTATSVLPIPVHPRPSVISVK